MNKRKILTYSSFVIASLLVIATFITTTTYIQLAFAIFFYFLIAYFVFKGFPRKARRYPAEKPATEVPPPVKSAEKAMPARPAGRPEETKIENIGIADIDKRAFLKIIGGAGLTFFLLSIFNKNIEGLFSKRLPGLGKLTAEPISGEKIDRDQSLPTAGYRISDVDDSVIAFYGFTNKDGAWFIMKEDTNTGSFRYSRGDSDFSGNWANRANLKYDYFHKLF